MVHCLLILWVREKAGRVSNKEGYPDRTAEVAIAHVTRQEKRRRKEKTNGDKRQTNTEKSNKN